MKINAKARNIMIGKTELVRSRSESVGKSNVRDVSTDIWKAGLNYNIKELDVVFGDLAPEQLMGSFLSQGVTEKLHKSIIIPKVSSKNRAGEESANSEIHNNLRCQSASPLSGTKPKENAKINDIKNKRFKEYLKKYFPKEDIIIRPMESIAKDLYSVPTNREEKFPHNVEVMNSRRDIINPNHLTVREKSIKELEVKSPRNSGLPTSGNGERFCPKEITTGIETHTTNELDGDKEDVFGLYNRLLLRTHKNSLDDPPTMRISKIYATEQDNRGDSSTYLKNVMDFYSIRKQIKRRQRREDIMTIRKLSSGEDALPLLTLAHHKKCDLPPPYQYNFRQKIRKKPDMDMRHNERKIDNSTTLKATEKKRSINEDTKMENYCSQLQFNRHRMTSACDCETCSYSQQSNPWVLKTKTSVPPIMLSNLQFKSNDSEQIFSSKNVALIEVGQLWADAKHSITLAQSCMVRALLPQLASVSNFGSPTRMNHYNYRRRLKQFRTLLLDPSFIKLMNENAVKNVHTIFSGKGNDSLRLSFLPSWERKFLGIHNSETVIHAVIAYLQPNNDFSSWLRV